MIPWWGNVLIALVALTGLLLLFVAGVAAIAIAIALFAERVTDEKAKETQ